MCNVLDISLTELFNGDYIKVEEIKEKTDEILYEQLEFNRKRNIIQILCSIMQGVGVALLFVPIYKEVSESLGAIIVMVGFSLFVAGLGIKFKSNN